MMFVLVGGGGFLGTHLRQRLHRDGEHETVIVSRSLPRTPLSANETYVSAADFASANAKSDDILRRASCLVYLATASTPSVFADQPWKEMTENVAPALASFDRLARLNPDARVVFLSSGGTIYGDQRSQATVSESTPATPISAYGLGKLAIEQALQFSHRIYGLSVATLRISNPVGLHARGGAQGLVPNILKALRSNSPVTIFGDGGSVRDYVDADDVAEAIWLASQDRRHPCETWNVGSGRGHSTMDVIREVTRATGATPALNYMPTRPGDVRSIVLDCRKIETDLGWRAQRPLQETIQRIWTEADGVTELDNAPKSSFFG